MSLFKKPVGRVMVALLLALGLAIAWSYLLVMVTDTVWWRLRRPVGSYQQFAVREDGVPFLATYVPGKGQQIRRWDGAALEADPPQGQLAGAVFSAPRRAGGQARWTERVVSCAPTWWYFVHDGRADGHGYFVAFDPNSKQQIGFIGRSGFQTEEPSEDQQFPFRGNGSVHLQIVYPHGYIVQGAPPTGYGYGLGDGSPYLFLISGGQLLRLDLSRRNLETTYDNGDLMSVAVRNTSLSMMPVGPETTLGPGPILPPVRRFLGAARTDELALRTDDALLFADSQGEVTARFVLPTELQQAMFTAYLLSNQQCLVDLWFAKQHELIWLNRDGTIADRQELKYSYLVSQGPMNLALFQAAACPVPAAVGLPLAFSYATGTPLGTMWQDPPAMQWLAMVLLLLISLLLAYVCFRRQQKYHFGAAWGWALFVFLMGVPGFLAYRWHRIWPTVERCPRCQAVTTVCGGRCAYCREELPLPAPTGIEIFA